MESDTTFQQWVTIQTFTYPQDAYIIQGALEAQGISTFIKNELTIQVDNFLSNAMGGIQLQVLEEQYKEAKEFLTANQYSIPGLNMTAVKYTKISTFKKSECNMNVCPFCGSENIVKNKKNTLLTILSIFLLGLPLPIFKSRYYCFTCEKEWKYK
jgi:hypothetical protein